MEMQYANFQNMITKFDPSQENRLEGPHFSTSRWEQDHGGVHPVEMLARIAKFQNKPEAKFEPYRKPFNRKGNSDFNKIISCTYDSIEAFGNGKQEKQGRLVSARNMICKLKQLNIGIVNETVAAGVKADFNPHKKPLVQQFKMFKSAGTLSSFVPASKDESSSSGGLSNPAAIERFEADKKEIDQFQAYIEGKISDPSEELEDETERASVETKAVTAPNIVFKRPPSDSQPEPDPNESEPPIKKSKFDDIEIGNLQSSGANEGGDVWNPEDYGYGSNYYGYNWRGRGRGRGHWGGGRGFQRGSWCGGGGYGYGS